eukprot:2554707-Pleurochrysis_carterae.AAC.1
MLSYVLVLDTELTCSTFRLFCPSSVSPITLFRLNLEVFRSASTAELALGRAKLQLVQFGEFAYERRPAPHDALERDEPDLADRACGHQDAQFGKLEEGAAQRALQDQQAAAGALPKVGCGL